MRRRTVLLVLGGLLACRAGSLPVDLETDRIENPKALEPFWERLQDPAAGVVDVVHFGDSHIQMGYFSGAVATQLQKRFGSCGDGMRFPYSACKSYGPRSLAFDTAGAWTCQNWIRPAHPEAMGATGYRLSSRDTNAVLRFRRKDTSGATRGPALATVTGTVNGLELVPRRVGVRVLGVSDSLGTTRWRVQADDGEFALGMRPTGETDPEFVLRGLGFPDPCCKGGIRYHNYGVVGAQWLQMTQASPLATVLAEVGRPGLAIFSFGTNESYDPAWNPDRYRTEIGGFLRRFREAMPGTAILVTGAPDTKASGKAPLHLDRVNALLRILALENGAAFWDLHRAMGGNGSVRSWSDHRLVNKDGMHFLRPGYELQGDLLALALSRAWQERYPEAWDLRTLVPIARLR